MNKINPRTELEMGKYYLAYFRHKKTGTYKVHTRVCIIIKNKDVMIRMDACKLLHVWHLRHTIGLDIYELDQVAHFDKEAMDGSYFQLNDDELITFLTPLIL